jgi:2-succinyl-5-enolpyruvyl-6-hydroxy-3-cyclohexene-1-carboxylate synthase
VVLASSMPIRDADAFASAVSRTLHVYSNRGANGIEGTVSTALGVAAASGRPTWVVAGDLAFLHDMGALLTAHRSEVPVGIVVVNNDGGGIFSFLPVSSAGAAFEPFFGTSHGLEFRALAEQFRADYVCVDEASRLAEAVQTPVERLRIVEARVPGRSDNVPVHQAWFQAVRVALGSGP